MCIISINTELRRIWAGKTDVPPYGHQEDFCIMNWKSTAEGSKLVGDTLP